jgi:putative inorganic carbon (hco3(-)) transporter
MENQLPYARPLYWLLVLFAAAAVASIALQNILIWPAVVLFLFAHFKGKRRIGWPQGLFPWATFIFLLTFFLGALAGVDRANSFHTVFKYLTFLLIFPIGAMALDSRETRKLLLFFTYGAAFCSLAGIYKHFFRHEERISSFSGDKMVFGGMLMAALLFQTLFLKDEPRKPLHWVSLGLLGWGFLLTETRGAWVAFGAGLAMLLWRLNRKWLLAGALAACAVFFALPRQYQDRVKSIVQVRLYYDGQGKFYNSEPGRFMIWASGLQIIRDYPWGVGQGNVEKVYPKYKYPIMAEPTEPHLHNDFLQICAQNGWIGLSAYLFWIAAYYLAAWRFKPPDPSSGDLNMAFVCVFTGVLVWGLTEYTFSHQFMNVQFFLLGLQLCLWKAAGRQGFGQDG